MKEESPIFLSGAQMDAIYQDQVISHYKGNPLIESLPPIRSEEEIILSLKPSLEFPFNPAERDLETHYRVECINGLKNYFYVPFRRDIELSEAISSTLRSALCGRNPMQPSFIRLLREQDILNPKTFQLHGRHVAVQGFALTGVSGTGKSTSLSYSLLAYPQVIFHSRYREKEFPFTQVVWLKLECPAKGSTKSLCLNFFQVIDVILGTNYYAKYAGNGRATAESMLPQMARVAALHGLGVLVVDEVQNLVGAPDDMLKFFVQLENIIGVPVILVGTPPATKLFTSEFRKARRSIGPENLAWDRFNKDNRWDRLMKNLFQYDWTRNGISSEGELSEIFHKRTMGIADLAVKLYIGAQKRAIKNKSETITGPLVESVADNMFQRIQPSLDTLAQGHYEDIKIQDLVLKEDKVKAYELSEENKDDILKALNEKIGTENAPIKLSSVGINEEETLHEQNEITKVQEKQLDDRHKQSELTKIVELNLKKKSSPINDLNKMGLINKGKDLRL
jgi:hypothetical protein